MCIRDSHDPWQFATDLEENCDHVILDHYLLGDGSQEGRRTKRTLLPQLLKETGLETWSTLEKFYEIVGIFKQVFSDENRVGISQEGFNANHS